VEQQLVPTGAAQSPIERVLSPSAGPRGAPVAARPHDWGLFGPDSISWRVHSNPVLLVGGLRTLIIQSLNPLAMAGIDEHSDYLARPHRMGASLVGKRTVSLPRAAKAAAKTENLA
jgi:uncharacterized protein (DUF2236 family)